MNRKKVRKLLDSVADQLTGETAALVKVLEEIKAAHQEAIDSGGVIMRAGLHYEIVKKVNKAIRLVQA